MIDGAPINDEFIFHDNDQACGESTLVCMADIGTSFASSPSKERACAARSGSLACMGSGINSGVTGLANSGFGRARNVLDVGLLGLSSFSRIESRFFSVTSADGRDWPKPCEVATCSIDLKYYAKSASEPTESKSFHTFTVLTCSSKVASSSTTIMACGCI